MEVLNFDNKNKIKDANLIYNSYNDGCDSNHSNKSKNSISESDKLYSPQELEEINAQYNQMKEYLNSIFDEP